MRGLNFKKLDLHIHTPASHDFIGDVSPEEIIAEAKRKGLDGIAITDHNCADWIDKVKKASIGQNITVFPGVEISCNGGKFGIHLIALFDPTKNGDHVRGLLSKLGITPGNQGKKEAIVHEFTIEKVIETVQSPDWDGLAILAHANSDKGVLNDMQGEQRTKIIQHPLLLAVEATDFQNQTQLIKRKRVCDFLDGTDSTYKRKLAVYQASDNPTSDNIGHCLEGIGTRCSYFKLEKINLDGLRQCFCDPDVRIRQDFEYQTQVFPHVKKIKITGGFLDGQEVEFHNGLNSILGAKGTGKSLLIELLRFGLNQPPSHKDILRDHESKISQKLRLYSYVEIIFVDDTGKQYSVKRTYNPENNHPFEVDINLPQIFPVLFLSQNEIIKIAENQQEQLSFIDSFFDFNMYKSKIEELEDGLKKLDREMADGIVAFGKEEELQHQINMLLQEIKQLDEILNHPIFRKYDSAVHKSKLFDEQLEYLQSIVNSFNHIDFSKIPDLPDDISSDPALKRNYDILQDMSSQLSNQIHEMQKNIHVKRSEVERERDLWGSDFNQIRREYEEFIREEGGDYQSHATKRAQKVRRLDELKKQLTIFQKKSESTRRISEQRNKLLDELETIYQEYTKERQERCRKFEDDSRGRLKLHILGSSNRDEFRNRLLELKQGSYLRESDIDLICEKLTPREFILAILRFKATKDKSVLRDISNKSEIPMDKMVKLAEILTIQFEPEKLLALQYQAYPQDIPEIKFNIGDDKYEPLDSISIGQKSTALLIMALSDGKTPIIIDQPEDSLDIRSIWDDICSKLRLSKERRQFIFTTHNSSIAVASDSDYFIVMESNSERGRIVYTGSMDHKPVSDEVLKYLEGGKDTYSKKYLKYRGDEILQN